MYLYNVAVSSSKYHGDTTLTYSSTNNLSLGSVVEVPLRNQHTLGVITGVAASSKNFKPKPITTAFDASLPSTHIELLNWMQQYYPAPIASIAQLFLPGKVVDITAEQTKKSATKELPALTNEQNNVLDKLRNLKTAAALLHGNTGTGKTRIYIELTRQAVKKQQSVIILVPEIGLTPQMITTFQEQFPNQVQSFHSKMTTVQRARIWRIIEETSLPQIIIGPRSALFMPLKNIGLIVVDEAHDLGYKQDQLPYYEATRVAAKLALLCNALCLYGTATPRIADYHRLITNKIPVLRLSRRINDSIQEPESIVIDAGNKELFNRSAVFSDVMLDNIEQTLMGKNQILIFLNRRGTARYINCANCGWHSSCTNCDTPFAYHGDAHILQCHVCGATEVVPTTCPDCHSSELRFRRHGTKALQNELQKIFPSASIARFDSDNNRDETLANNYERVAKGCIDILIGTQVLAKGLDLNNLTLVCIPNADLSTFIPDYTADEKTYQLLRQVIGRVGRRDKLSKVIVQTYSPKSSIISSVITNSWEEFYSQQILQRKKYNYPPFSYFLQLTTIRASRKNAKNSAENLKVMLKKSHPAVNFLGPSPRFHEKVQGKYQWQLLVSSRQRGELISIIKSLPSGWRYNIDPGDLL